MVFGFFFFFLVFSFGVSAFLGFRILLSSFFVVMVFEKCVGGATSRSTILHLITFSLTNEVYQNFIGVV